jgi:hypothetical protein
MIVIEGPDGAGKTTLAKWICEQFGLEGGVRSTSNRDEIYRYTRMDTWSAVYTELRCKQPPVVWDRIGPFSDPIYSSLGIPNDRPCSFSSHELELFDQVMASLGLVIVCLPPMTTVLSNVDSTHQLDQVADKTPQIYSAYLPLADHYTTYDYTMQHPGELTHLIAEHLYYRKERERLAVDLGQL